MSGTCSRSFWGDRRGTSAIEFALILPVFIMLVMGVINVSLLTNAVSSMNFAVQEAARCAAVNSVTCPSAAAAATFAGTKYVGPTIHPVFVSDNSGCGHTVTGTATFQLNVGIQVYSLPLRVAACYPA